MLFPFRDHNPSERTPYVTLALIGINVVVFLLMLPKFGNDFEIARFFDTWGLVPARLWSDPLTVLTSMFLHGGVAHILGNMLFLWIYGDNLEEEMGHAGFLAFYLAGGVGAALAQVLADPSSNVPMVGASGAIAAVMGGYLLMFPKARVDVLFILIVFFRVFTIPAWIVLGFWFAGQIFSGVSTPTNGGGVAYWAHAGGFLAGLLLTLPIWTRLGGMRFWDRTHGHPPHPDAKYRFGRTSIPRVPRR